MPVRFIVRTTERSITLAGIPAAEEIARGFREGLAGIPGLASKGAWVGPRPRVTRVAVVPQGFFTRAVWLVEWQDSVLTARRGVTPYNEVLAGNVYQRLRAVTEGLVASGVWSAPVVEPYAPALHGPLDWWQSGRAAVTQTQDEFPVGFARLTDATENPSGPTTPETHPSTQTDALEDLGESLGEGATKAAAGLAWIVGGVAATAAVVGVVLARRKVRQAARVMARRSNPRGRRRSR